MPTRGASNKSQQLPPLGPLFRQVEAVDGRAVSPASLVAAGRASPVVVRGAASSWPALGAWSFSALADAAAASQCVGTLQAGLAEQGATQPPVCTPASAYLSNLAAAAPSVPPGDGLAPSGSDEAAALEGGLETRLRWSFLSSFKPDAPYLAQWDMLRQIPVLRADAPTAATLWPRWWRSFDFVWLGPARTVTGLHFDRPANWFTQLRGVKEVVLLPPGNAHLLPLNEKYDFGAYSCSLDITRLPSSAPGSLAAFASASGALYCRLEAGDSLFIPPFWFHAVVALSPSASLSAFGHSPASLVTTGLGLELLDAAHQLGLWRWGHCFCHAAGVPRPLGAAALTAAAVGAAALGMAVAAWARPQT